MRGAAGGDNAGAPVGRSAQHGQLAHLLRETSSGASGGAVVRGDTGSGKSSVLAYTAVLGRRAHFHVVEVPAAQAGAPEGLPTLLREMLLVLKPPPFGRHPAGTDQHSTDNDPWTVLESIARTITSWAAVRPVLVLIDDVHHREGASAALLPALAQRLRGVRCALIVSGAARLSPNAPWRGALHACLALPGFADIPLPPLDRAAVVDYATSRLGASHAASLGEWLSVQSAGNPDALRALVDQALRAGLPPRTAKLPRAAALPRGHRLVQQVMAMGPHATQLAALVSTMEGMTLNTVDSAAATLGLPEAVAEDAANALLEQGVLTLSADGLLRHRIPVIGTTLEPEVSGEITRQVHGAAAAALLQRRASGREVALPELANHFLSGQLVHDDSVAALRDAADLVITNDPKTAVTWLFAALHRLERGDSRRIELLDRLITPLRRLDRWRELVDAIRVSLAEQPFEASSQEQRGLVCQLLDALARLDLNEEALDVVVLARRNRVSDPDIVGRHARILCLLERFEEMGDVLWSVVHSADVPSTDRRIAAVGLLVNAGLTSTVHDLTNRVEQLTAHLPALRDRTLPIDQLRCALTFGDFVSAERIIQNTSAATHPVSNQLEALCTARIAFLEGDWDAVLRSGDAALRLPKMSATNAGHALRALCAEVQLHRENPTAAEQLLKDARTDIVCGYLVAGARAQWQLGRGSVDHARTTLRDSIRRSTELGYRSGVGRVLLALVELEVAAGDRQAAEQLLPALLSIATAAGTAADTFRYLHGSALARRQPQLAASALAVLEDNEGHRPFVRARAQQLAGRLGHNAAGNLREAYETFRGLGATGWQRSTAAAMREAHIPVPRQRAVSEDTASLEQRLVDLIIAGKTNRQTAAELHVSPKTVESHLSRIYARTGCRSRVELAALCRTRGRTQP